MKILNLDQVRFGQIS